MFFRKTRVMKKASAGGKKKASQSFFFLSSFLSMVRSLLMRFSAAAVARHRQLVGHAGSGKAAVVAAASLLSRANARAPPLPLPTAMIGGRGQSLSTSTTSSTSSTSTPTSAHRGDRDYSPYEYEAPVSLSELHRRRKAAAASSASSSSSSSAPARHSRARAPPSPPPSFSLDIDDGDGDDEDDEGEDKERDFDARARARERATSPRARRPLGGAATSVPISSPSTSAADDEEASASVTKVTRALNSAAGSLSRRPHSLAELERKLHDRGHSPEAARLALERLRGMGLLPSDREFARAFARAKFRAVAWAPWRIRTELVRGRGVSPEDASAALRDVFGGEAPICFVDTDEEDDEADRLRGERSDENDGEEGGDESNGDDDDGDDGDDDDDAGRGLSSVFEASWDPISRKEQAARLLEAAERQAHLSRGLPLAARRRRLAGWLARRGHGWKTVSAVMEKVGL